MKCSSSNPTAASPSARSASTCATTCRTPARAGPRPRSPVLRGRSGTAQRRHRGRPDAGLRAANFFESVPTGGDVYLLSRVLHDWADDDAVRILRTCRAAMTPEARLLVVDAVLPAMARDKPAAIRMDQLMLLLFRARERMGAEFHDLLARAGFEVLRVIPTGSPTGLAIIEARCNFFTPSGERC